MSIITAWALAVALGQSQTAEAQAAAAARQELVSTSQRYEDRRRAAQSRLTDWIEGLEPEECRALATTARDLRLAAYDAEFLLSREYLEPISTLARRTAVEARGEAGGVLIDLLSNPAVSRDEFVGTLERQSDEAERQARLCVNRRAGQ